MTEFISRSYGQDEFEVIIKTDNKEHYKKAEDFSRKLIDHAKPQTNADRIRAMSDEELAEFLCEINGCYKVNCPGKELCKFGDGKSNGLKKWLKQPAEEGKK